MLFRSVSAAPQSLREIKNFMKFQLQNEGWRDIVSYVELFPFRQEEGQSGIKCNSVKYDDLTLQCIPNTIAIIIFRGGTI